MEALIPFAIIATLIIAICILVIIIMIAPFVIKVKDVTIYTEKKVSENAKVLYDVIEENDKKSVSVIRHIMEHFGIAEEGKL